MKSAEICCRWRKCVTSATNNFGAKISLLLIEADNGEQKRKDVLALMERLRPAFSDIIQHSDWMDPG